MQILFHPTLLTFHSEETRINALFTTGLTIIGIVTFSVTASVCSIVVIALDLDNYMQISRYVVGVEVNLLLSCFVAKPGYGTRIGHRRNLCQCQLDLALCMRANCASSRPMHNYPSICREKFRV